MVVRAHVTRLAATTLACWQGQETLRSGCLAAMPSFRDARKDPASTELRATRAKLAGACALRTRRCLYSRASRRKVEWMAPSPAGSRHGSWRPSQCRACKAAARNRPHFDEFRVESA
eukprot:5770671-Pleurochrysis_carterae.AAC.3